MVAVGYAGLQRLADVLVHYSDSYRLLEIPLAGSTYMRNGILDLLP